MIKKLIVFTIVSCICIAFCGCSNNSSIGENFNGKFCIFDCRVQNGQLEYNNELGMNEFLSYETMETTPLCTKPDCLHDGSKDCYGYGKELGEFIHNGKLYWFENTANVENGEVRQFMNFMQSDVTGYNEIVISSIEGYEFGTAATPCVKKDDVLYFTPFKKIGDTYEQQLFMLDINTKKLTTLAILGSEAKFLHGIFDNKLYFEDFYFDISSSSFVKNSKITDSPSSSTYYAIFDDYYLYELNKKLHIIKENEDNEIIIENVELNDYVVVINDILFNTSPGQKPYYIDLKESSLRHMEFDNPVPNSDIVFYNKYKDSYIIYTAKEESDEGEQANNWIIDYKKIPVSDILKG